jgi:hypothetical protein
VSQHTGLLHGGADIFQIVQRACQRFVEIQVLACRGRADNQRPAADRLGTDADHVDVVSSQRAIQVVQQRDAQPIGELLGSADGAIFDPRIVGQPDQRHRGSAAKAAA